MMVYQVKFAIKIVVAGLWLMLLSGCSTKKNTVVTRNYHNITSYYNIYFNALDAYQVGVKKAQTSFKDNYNNLLPLFQFSTREAARSMLPDMDKAYKKCSKLVTIHSLKAKPKMKKGGLRTERERAFFKKNEYNKWVDDSFLLMGKAYFMKHDFFPAIESLEYVIREFAEDGLKDEASLWLARCHIELKNYREATEILNRLEAQPGFLEDLVPDLMASRADIHLRLEEWPEAANYLDRAARSYKDKSQRTRIWFVLALVYEKLDELMLASQAFGEVTALNPPYEMAFTARINRARLFEGDPAAGAEIRKELVKMLKDDKNLDYLDQVYYALAELDMKENRVEDAIKNYYMSVWSSTDNATQKAISYLALGKHYYGRKEYIPAAAYYDSCSQFLPEDYLGQKLIIDLSDDLRVLADNMKVILREDSLQRVARMPEAEREELIGKLVREARDLEEEQKRLEEQMMAGMQGGRGGSGGGGSRMAPATQIQGGMGGRGEMGMGGGQPGMPGGLDGSFGAATSWYFYNPATISFGQSEYIKIWGRRKLEDNWRRANKRIASMANDLSSEGEKGEIETPLATSKASQYRPTTRDYYIADLPMSDTLMKESDRRIAAALLNVGKVFKEEFILPAEAVPNLVSLTERYPESERLLPAYYNLYEIYTLMIPEPAEAERYKELILQKFPESRSAQIISNPNYFQELEDHRLEAQEFYLKTFEAYQSGADATVLENSRLADTAFKVNPYRDRFGLLNAMAFARQNPSDTVGIKARLNDLMFKFPDSEIIEPAKNLLAYLENGPQSKPAAGGSRLQVGRVQRPALEGPVVYEFKPTQVHFYVTVVSTRSLDVNRLKFRISDFNVENFDDEFYEVNAVPLNEDLQMVVVKNFNDQKRAMDYYQAILASDLVYEDFSEIDYRHFVISKENYNLFFQHKNVFQYIQFFRENYLNN